MKSLFFAICLIALCAIGIHYHNKHSNESIAKRESAKIAKMDVESTRLHDDTDRMLQRGKYRQSDKVLFTFKKTNFSRIRPEEVNADKLDDGTPIVWYFGYAYMATDDTVRWGYDRILSFEDGHCLGMYNRFCYLLNKKGERLTNGFHKIAHFDGAYLGQFDNQFYLIGKDGKQITSNGYDGSVPAIDGYLARRGTTFYALNEAGNEIAVLSFRL